MEEYRVKYGCAKSASGVRKGGFGGGVREILEKPQCANLPLTTSLTHATSAKMSILYSNRRRASILTYTGEEQEPWLKEESPAGRRAASAEECAATLVSRCSDDIGR